VKYRTVVKAAVHIGEEVGNAKWRARGIKFEFNVAQTGLQQYMGIFCAAREGRQGKHKGGGQQQFFHQGFQHGQSLCAGY